MMKRLLMFLLTAACAGADESGAWAGSVETLPNGGTRVLNPAAGAWQGESSWNLVPELVIGATEGPEEETFGALTGLQVDDAGRIYVVDRQTNELRIFGPDGAFVRSVGRTGDGPGEYRNANGLLWIAEGTLAVIDQRGNRYTLLSSEGEYVRSVPRPLGFYGWAFRGDYSAGHIYELSGVGNGPDRLPALLGISLSAAPAATEEGAPPSSEEASSPGTFAVDTVMLPVPNAPLYESYSVRTAQGGMGMTVPFTPRPIYLLDREGTIWHGHGGEFRIARSSFEGDTLMEIVLDATGTPVAQEELAEWESAEAVTRFREMGGNLDMSRIPTVKPFFDDLQVDADGFLWVSVPSPPNQVLFSVFDPDGRFLGRLQADGMERDTSVPPVVRNGRLYFVGRDELDVQRVYVFRIEK
jgi:hypothetical protein